MPDDALEHQHEVWEEWAKADPLWAILSDPSRKNGRWDLEEFFANGRSEIDALFAELEARGIAVPLGRCLDFGCGAGRLTQALAARFERADGVDISETMIELARRHNRQGERCHYHVNRLDDLSLFPAASFDLVYSTIVLQHNPPELALAYMAEFVRILRPGGVAVFDMPTGFVEHSLPEGAHQARVEILRAPDELAPGATGTVRAQIGNTSALDWPEGPALRLANHWRLGGSTVVPDDGRADVPLPLAAGAATERDLEVTAPDTAGRYELVLDLVEEGITWFESHGSPVATAEVRVAVPRRSLLGRVTGRGSPPVSGAPAAEPEPFTMGALPREQVEAAIGAAGGRVLDRRPSDAAGPNWPGQRYFVTTGP